MSAAIRLELTNAAEQVLEQIASAPQRVAGELRQGLTEVLVDLENYVKIEQLTGGDPDAARNGTLPLPVRSGNLRAAVGHVLDRPLSGVFGTTKGVTTAYARAQLGPDDTTITPKNSRWLWIPIGENRSKLGGAKMSPREALEQKGPRGGRRLRIFKSSNGNWVAFMPAGGSYKRNVTNRKDGTTKRKGQAKGELLFVLKDQVTIKGTDALRLAYDAREGFVIERLQKALDNITGGAA